MPIPDDTEKNKHDKKHEVNKNKSILLQKIENKDKRKMSKNEQRPTQDIVLSVIYQSIYNNATSFMNIIFI